MHKVIQQITEQIALRSQDTRAAYLQQLEHARLQGPHRHHLACGNLAHGFAACSKIDKLRLREKQQANIAIVSAYNDMLSAHQPYVDYPAQIKHAIHEVGGVAQFAGGVPAMCDGITQGQPGIELSLMSRDVIALASAVALSHNMFDGGLMLGICDKIVPGLLMAALTFGHLPFIFIPAGPMTSGIPNKEKANVRELYTQGKVSKESLLDVEAASYHSPGTCTFYGTANSNQLIVEMLGLHLPGASFVNPHTPLREALTKAAAQRVVKLTHLEQEYLPIGHLINEKSLVNGLVGLLASGGSTNHTMHLIAIARMAGYQLNWSDFAALSKVTPLIAKVYPNGQADINHFQQAGGMAFFMRTLLESGHLHADVKTVKGDNLWEYTRTPMLDNQQLVWVDGPRESTNPAVLTSAQTPFNEQGGLVVLEGNLGRAILKTSALASPLFKLEAPAEVFRNQDELQQAFKSGRLNKDFVAVVSFQGPKACGMPELHHLIPPLSVLQDKGYQVALITDGRMSGASGKVPAAIHVTPEAYDQGNIARIKTGDLISLDSENCTLNVLVDAAELAQRVTSTPDLSSYHQGMGRELFGNMRRQLSSAEEGACSL